MIFLSPITVEANNCLDDEDNQIDYLNHLIKPPANLVVVEGDCLENISESSKLDSYLVMHPFMLLSGSCISNALTHLSKLYCGIS